MAGNAHYARHGLCHEIEAGPVGPRSGLAKAGNARINDPRVDGRDHFIVDAEALHDARPVIFDDDIGGLGELQKGRPAGRVFQVERDASLVAVQVEETHAVGSLHLEAHRAARLVAAARRLDLDDVGAKIGQQHGAERAGHHLRHVEHFDAGERKPRAFGRLMRCAGPRRMR